VFLWLVYGRHDGSPSPFTRRSGRIRSSKPEPTRSCTCRPPPPPPPPPSPPPSPPPPRPNHKPTTKPPSGLVVESSLVWPVELSLHDPLPRSMSRRESLLRPLLSSDRGFNAHGLSPLLSSPERKTIFGFMINLSAEPCPFFCVLCSFSSWSWPFSFLATQVRRMIRLQRWRFLALVLEGTGRKWIHFTTTSRFLGR